MNDIQAAQGIRRRIELTGPLRMPARQLRDDFGRQRLTAKARREINGSLLNERLATRPSILEVDADELIAVYVAEGQTVAAAPPPRRRTVWGEYRRLPAWLQLLAPVMALILIASVAGGGSSGKRDQHAQPARIATQPAESGTNSYSDAQARRERRAERRRAAEARREEHRRLERAAPPSSDSGDSGGSGCDPNYSGACVPTGQGDVDCGDIPETDFESIGSDPDRLDADRDGIACES